jgi:hypothetical protein
MARGLSRIRLISADQQSSNRVIFAILCVFVVNTVSPFHHQRAKTDRQKL